MRPIKFRAWNKKRKTMGSAMPLDVLLLDVAEDPSGPREELANCEVMQFTGLHDKNGKEIYEGDMVRHEYYPADPEHGTAKETEEIAYAEGGFGFKRDDEILHLHECMFLTNGVAKDLEVIGNIYENPELLNAQ